MNISNTLAASFFLGLLACLSGTALASMDGDPRVRVVELPGESRYPEIGFSDDGETISWTREASGEVLLSIHRGEGWELVKRVIGSDLFSLKSFGISDDGAVIGETDYLNVSLIEGALTTVYPNSWLDSGFDWSHWYLQGEVLSGDGLHVGVDGRPRDDFYFDALLWDGESRFVNLSQDLIQEERNYLIRGVSFDGSAAVFNSSYPAPLNNIRYLGTERDVWVWEDGELTIVPPIAASYEVVMRARAMSGDGQAVVGTAEGLWRHGFENDDRIYTAGAINELLRSPAHAWIWTQASGTVEISYPERFESLGAWDITYDASTVFGGGYSPDGTGWHRLLWYRADNQFVMIDDLFTKLGIVINADWYSFSQISGDGSKLMGVSQLDGQYSAIIVTIPIHKP